MYDSHAHLEITEPQWQAFLDDFQTTLDKYEVAATEQQELFAIVESTKKDIVLGSTQTSLLVSITGFSIRDLFTGKNRNQSPHPVINRVTDHQ